MQVRGLFGVGLRLLGIWFLYGAATNSMWALLRISNAMPSSASYLGVSDYHNISDKLLAAIDLAFALVLIGFADHVVRFCYGPVSKPSAPPAEAAD